MSNWGIEQQHVLTGPQVVNISNTANTWSAWTELWASVPHDVSEIIIGNGNGNYSGGNNRFFEFGLGGGFGTVDTTIVSQAIHNTDKQDSMRVPIFVPRGARLSVRWYSSTGDQPWGYHLVSGGALTPRMFTQINSLNSDLTNYRGSVLVDAGAVANTWGSWTQIVASTAHPYRGLWVMDMYAGTAQNTDTEMQIGLGGAGSEVIVMHYIPRDNRDDKPVRWLYLNIPQGTRIAARRKCGSTANPGPRTGYPIVLGLR